MSGPKYHAWTHSPDGTDPLKFAAGGQQIQVYSVFGEEWQVLTSKGNYTGGNGSDATTGDWSPITDMTAPFGGYVETTTDDDWIAFGMQLGPKGTGWAVAVWFYLDTGAGVFDIDWATSSVNEADNTPTVGPVGSSTSVVTPQDVTYHDAPAFAWYNTDNAGDAAFYYKVDGYTVAPGWDCVVERSPFFVNGEDGDPLTANASGYGNFEKNKAFNGGGGSDNVWWCRFHVNGKNASSSGYQTRIAGVRVYRFSGGSYAIN